MTSKTYDHDDFGRIAGIDDDALPLEQMRDEQKEPEPVFEQSGIQPRRSTRKRKAPADEEQPSSPAQPDYTQPSGISEPVEQPSMAIVPEMPPTPSPAHQPEVPLPQEPAVPDISSIMSAVDQSDMIGAGTSADNLMTMEMPQIPPNEVSSLLDTPEEHVDEEPPASIPPPDGLPQMENMGYDQNAPPVTYMPGYDEAHPSAHTPGAISERGPATPWNHEDYEFPPSVGPVRK